uniref:Uncharacterized protein n=1 Tax=Pithovirus LCDPAC02 TaxID=2506601 RepID=A0A481YNK4_9VIRU|nr:MAG: hypothetical protein LCDPAC02_00500 [Pithovirus LCDPAC02]
MLSIIDITNVIFQDKDINQKYGKYKKYIIDIINEENKTFEFNLHFIFDKLKYMFYVNLLYLNNNLINIYEFYVKYCDIDRTNLDMIIELRNKFKNNKELYTEKINIFINNNNYDNSLKTISIIYDQYLYKYIKLYKNIDCFYICSHFQYILLKMFDTSNYDKSKFDELFNKKYTKIFKNILIEIEIIKFKCE